MGILGIGYLSILVECMFFKSLEVDYLVFVLDLNSYLVVIIHLSKVNFEICNSHFKIKCEVINVMVWMNKLLNALHRK